MTERRDKGLPQLTARDRYILTWIGEQYAVRFDTLEKLLGRMPGKSHNQPKELGKLNRKTVYRLISRLEQLGLLEYQKFWDDTPGWVWLTSTGLRAQALAYAPWSPRQGTDFQHLHITNEVRFRLETSKQGDQLAWESERALRKEAGEGAEADKKHLPDAAVTVDGSLIAIQVELTPKSGKRTQAIIANLLSRYAGIWYFVNEVTDPVIRKSIGTSKKVNLYQLGEILKPKP